MSTRKSLWILFGILIVSAWVLGFSVQARAETLKCKSETKQSVRADEQAAESYFLGVNSRVGSFTCENGDEGMVNSYAVWEANWPREVITQIYTVYRFKDMSKIITKGTVIQTQDPKGEAEWIWEGTSEIIRGGYRFNGIKGNVSFKGKQVPPEKKSINELTFTYTLPPK
jgi:hypothetical protein